jgi:serine/threonine protein phosphatase PrpC
MSTVIAAGISDVGRVRDHNEDSFHVDADAGVFVVADGMGGHAAGEVASKLAVDTVASSWSSAGIQRQLRQVAQRGDAETRQALVGSLRQSVLAAHLAILERGEAEPDKAGMGTTLTAFAIAGSEAFFAHAGDSRAYLVRDRIPLLLSEDHTILARMRAVGIEKGVEEGPAPERFRGILTNSLGVGDARVATFILPIYSGDRIVLCTDGVHDYVSEVELGEVVSAAPSPARACQGLISMALERGGADNATVITAKVMEADETHVPIEVIERDDRAVASCKLFAELSGQERLRALRVTTPREYEPGERIPRAALEDRVTYVVLDGRVSFDGTELSAGGLLYPESLVSGAANRGGVAEAVDKVRLLMIRRNDFQELCDDDTDLGVKLLGNVAGLMAR